MFINVSFTEIRFLSKTEFRSEKDQNSNSRDKKSKLKTKIVLKNQNGKINSRVLHFCFKFKIQFSK